MLRTTLQVRYLSSKPIRHDSIFVVSLPITTHRSYIYCNHRPSLLTKEDAKALPLFNKIETKLVGLVEKGWIKLKLSENIANKKVVELATYLLDKLPYEEKCLLSFPSKNSMIREINEEAKGLTTEVSPSLVVLAQSQITDLDIANQVKPIPLLHPSFQPPLAILGQLTKFRDEAHAKHLKYAILCGVGIPLSLPFALVPIIPNVPGIYLAYRLYCHIKVLLGAQHLGYLLETDSTAPDTNHITFQENAVLDALYNIDNVDSEKERLLLTPQIIDQLSSDLGFDYLASDLHKALKQESKRLANNL